MPTDDRRRRGRGRPADPERRRRRQAELREAAFSLFLRRGLENVTIDQIVRAAGHAKGSFYQHFANKEALVEASYRSIGERLGAAFERLRTTLRALSGGADFRSVYQLFAGQISLVMLQDRPAARLYLQERAGPATASRRPIVEIAERLESEAIEATKVAAELGLLRPGNPATLALLVVGAIERVLHGVLSGRLDDEVSVVSDDVTRLLLGGIARDES